MQISFVTSLTGFAVKARVVLGSQSIGTLLCVEKKMVMWAFSFLASYIYTQQKAVLFQKDTLFQIQKLVFYSLDLMASSLFSFQHHDNVSQSWAPEDCRAPGVRRMREKDPRQVNLILMSLFKKKGQKIEKGSKIILYIFLSPWYLFYLCISRVYLLFPSY